MRLPCIKYGGSGCYAEARTEDVFWARLTERKRESFFLPFSPSLRPWCFFLGASASHVTLAFWKLCKKSFFIKSSCGARVWQIHGLVSIHISGRVTKARPLEAKKPPSACYRKFIRRFQGKCCMLFRPFRTIARCWLVWRKTTKNKLVYQRGRLLLELNWLFFSKCPLETSRMHLLPRGCSFFSTWSINFEVHFLYSISRKKASDAFFGRFWISLDRRSSKGKGNCTPPEGIANNQHPEREGISFSRTKSCQSPRPAPFKGLMKSKQRPSPPSFPPQTILDLLLPLVAKAKNILKEGKEANKVFFWGGILLPLDVVHRMKPRTFPFKIG